MASNARFAEVAALAGDPARAAMLQTLMDGRALTASELAHVAGVSPQTTSGHLARMVEAGLLRMGDGKYHTGKAREFFFSGVEHEHYAPAQGVAAEGG